MSNLILFQILLLAVFCVIFFNIDKKFKTQDQMNAHTAEAIVITCMDFRLIDDTVKYLDNLGYNNNYDNFILAGASLGYNQKKYTAWIETLDTHIELAKNLHEIKEVIVIDHMHCGAYKIFYNKKSISRNEEIELHKQNLSAFEKSINKKYPKLKVKTLLMDLDGTMIKI